MAIVVPERKALVIRLKDYGRVTAVLPKYQHVMHDNVPVLAVPHTTDVWHVLRNIGVTVTGYEPMRSYYQYPKLGGEFDPMQHQRETAVFCSTHMRCYILSEMRTGKSASVAWASDFLRRTKSVKRTLILSTMSCMTMWKNTIWSLFPDSRVNVLHGDKAQRVKLLNQDAEYYVINHDGIKTIERELANAIANGHIDLIVMDEGAEFRNAGTAKFKSLRLITAKCPRIWWLTGTPTPKSPEDAWAQCRVVTPETTPTSFKAWRDRVMMQISTFKWVPRTGAYEEVHKLMQPAIRYRKSDVIEVMPVTYDDREAPLTTEQRHIFDEIKAEGAVRSANGTISAVNAGIMVAKLLQISMGVVRTDSGETMEYLPKTRLAALQEIIEGAEAKVIVFAPYHAVVDLLVREIRKYTTVEFIDGRVTGRNRDRVISNFQDTEHPRVLVAHPRTTGHGLELAAANVIVWFGPVFGTEYEQANHRVLSGKQVHSVGIYHLGATSMEWRIYKALRNQVDVQSQMLDLYNEIIETA